MFLRTLARRLGLFGSATPTRAFSRRPRLETLEDRIALNNRFVVPFEQAADDTTTFHLLSRALTKPGLASGDVVQVEPNSTPGLLADAHLPAVPNLTIRGHQGFAARDLPQITTSNAIGVDAAQTGLSLENLNLYFTNALTFNANASLLSSHVVYAGPGNIDFITLNGTAAAIVRNNTILNLTIASANDTIQVTTAANSANLIAANTIQVFNAALHVRYTGNNTITDRVEDNVFLGNESPDFETSTGMMVVEALSGLTIQRNQFRDRTNFVTPLFIQLGAQNVRVLNNEFDLPNFMLDVRLVTISGAAAGLTTSVTVAYNRFRSTSIGVFIAPSSSGTTSVKVEGNDFVGNDIGVHIANVNGALTNIDLGGGNQGSRGGNNFRTFRSTASSDRGAIVAGSDPNSFALIQAQNNLFGTADPETAVFDNGDEAARTNVTTTGALTGNQAFVQALYVRFLRRVGDVNNANDAGLWVNLLNGGMAASTVAFNIVRSPEALGYVVDGLYKGILGRDADAGGRLHHINLLANGMTIEQIQSGFLAGAEYRLRFAGDSAYIASLYQTLLGRSPSQPEINSWLNLLPSLGRQGIAAGFLGSTEFRNREVTKLYFDILKRTTAPSAADVTANVNTGLDLLSLRVAFAGSAEFFANG